MLISRSYSILTSLFDFANGQNIEAQVWKHRPTNPDIDRGHCIFAVSYKVRHKTHVTITPHETNTMIYDRFSWHHFKSVNAKHRITT